MDYKQFISMLSDFQREAFNLGFKVAKNDPTADDKVVTDMFHSIIDYIKTNTKETENV